MTHCISVVITKHNDNLKQFFPQIKTHNGFDVFPIPVHFDLGMHLIMTGNDFVYANTDYFGGCGEQDAQHFSINNKYFPTHFPDNTKGGAINKALQLLGVTIVDGCHDEFESVGLHKYRSNYDFGEHHE